MKKFGRFFWQSPKNNDIRLRRAKALRSESFVFPSFFFAFPSFHERVARRENGLCLLSLRQNKNSSFPGHAPGKDTLRAANAATERGQTGENARANAVSRRALSPVKIKIPVASADMRRHSDTLRGAQRRRKWGLTGEKTHEQAFCAARVFAPPSFPVDIALQYHLCRQRIDHTASFF